MGKTISAACIAKSLKADYWKPIQVGLEHRDTDIVSRLLGPSHPGRFHKERYALKLPASPHLAAEAEGIHLRTSDFELPLTGNHLIVEGAGGCLVPLNEEEDILDLAKHLDLEVILVVNPYLGAYNHTLLSMNAIRERGLTFRGFIISGGEDQNFADFIVRKTKEPFLGCIPEIKTLEGSLLPSIFPELNLAILGEPCSPDALGPSSLFSLRERDRTSIWHPFTQHQTEPSPLPIARAEGAYLYTNDGRKIFDAISSWWVNLHGHCHPHIASAVSRQVAQLEHVLFAGCTHEPAVALAERILGYLPFLSKVFYSDNGSTAVEAAVKMALQFWHNRGSKRNRIVAFQGAYHGDTFGSMAVSRSGFTTAFTHFLFDVSFIDPPLRERERGASLAQMRRLLEERDDISAFLFEPLVQGAGGMLMQDAGELDALIGLARDHGVLCIADEVMTGFGRTGKAFACDFLTNKPDILCLSKGLSGGVSPLAMTICREFIFAAFLSSDKRKAFLTGHSYTANPLACAAGLASLDLFECSESIRSREHIAEAHARFRKEIAEHSSARLWFKDVRQQGTILALEWNSRQERDYFANQRDSMYKYFLKKDLLLRPLGDILYILPPYCSSMEDLKRVYSAILQYGEERGCI